MNKIFQIQGSLMAVLLCLAFGFQAQAQNTATCNMSIGGVNYPINAVVQATCQTGLDFNLSLTLPGLSNCGGNYNVSITTSPNLLLGSSSTVPFSGAPPTYTNTAVISNNIGTNVLVAFKFKPGVTCNGEKGDFTINVTTTCGGAAPISCQLKVSLTAVAQNYWTVEKKHLWGNLKGGYMLWKITLKNNHSLLGVGDYDIAAGTIIDNVNCDKIISVTGGYSTSPTPTGLNTSTATWNTGVIPSYVQQVEYIVTTICCSPGVSTVTNCANYNFKLGKSGFGVVPCDVMTGQKCDSKAVVTAPLCTVPFSKALTYPAGNQVNYAQGCEGEYTMCINNNGNLPLTNLTLTDNFPPSSQIAVSQICVYGYSGANMGYTVNFPGGLPTSSGSGNVATNQCFNFSTPPTSMTFQSTSGSLTYGTICIKVRFKIKAGPGTLVHNCATLNYTGSYNGTANICNTTIQPCTGSVNSCADFKVEQPKAVPGLAKCINGGQSYLVGQVVPFCVVVSNHGAASMSGFNLGDVLGSPQNLEIVPGSITYAAGTTYYSGYTPCCPYVGTPSVTPPAWLVPNITNLQSPTWTINGMPGECRFDQASYLVIKFDARIKPQSYGQYTNKATLTGPGTSLTAPAPYNVQRIAEIRTSKMVNNGPGQAFAASGFVNPGSNFQYLLRVENIGSVGLKSIMIKDAFPTCVEFTCPPAPIICNIYNASGAFLSSTTATCSTVSGNTTFTLLAAATLAPGDYVDLIVTVKRIGNTPETCCNKEAFGFGTATDAGNQTIQDSDGPVCVNKSICCDLDEVIIQPFTQVPPTSGNYWNFGLTIFAGSLPIQEVDISVMDYQFTYQSSACKPTNVGNYTGHLLTNTPNIGGGLYLTNPNNTTNNLLNWKAGTPVMFTGGQTFKLQIMRPWMLPLSCCKGNFYYCLKVRLKDVKCRVCEKIICFNVPMGAINNPTEIQEKLDILGAGSMIQSGN